MSSIPNYIVMPKLKGKGQKPITNLVGKKFGFLEAIDLALSETKHTRWLCRCACGKEKAILGTHLTRGLINSCGCKHGELISKAKQTDLRGRRYGRWTVTDGPFHKGPNILWGCVCSCGGMGRIYAGHLVAGNSRSCGCLAKEVTSECNSTHGAAKGGVRLVEYQTWLGMQARCRHHEGYAGRGIVVCSGWSEFPYFHKDMGDRPQGRRWSIHRVDNDKNYSCGHCEECKREGWDFNCIWATDKIQASEKRNNVKIEFHGITKIAVEWDRTFGLKEGTTSSRFNRGWTIERISTTPMLR